MAFDPERYNGLIADPMFRFGMDAFGWLVLVACYISHAIGFSNGVSAVANNDIR
ncbi:MAG: hypothetical protein R2827_05000 [Bdellovibrionales bacterium]